MATNFTYRILSCQTWDIYDDNLDVEIDLSDGRGYSATFFTIPNIRTLMNKNRVTGECSGGLYLWASNMIIIENLGSDTIERTIAGLIEDKEIDAVCYRLR